MNTGMSPRVAKASNGLSVDIAHRSSLDRTLDTTLNLQSRMNTGIAGKPSVSHLRNMRIAGSLRVRRKHKARTKGGGFPVPRAGGSRDEASPHESGD